MKASPSVLRAFSALLLAAAASCAAPAPAPGPARFASHVTVNTPARSFSHGVGNPLPTAGRRAGQHSSPRGRGSGGGYPRFRPAVPFSAEERPRGGSVSSWHLNTFQEGSLAVLPASPYRVDSPDPESLWPRGLFLPPRPPHVFARRAGAGGAGGGGGPSLQEHAEPADPRDPYLLEGSEALAAVRRATTHGLYYFHDIPHITSLLANQQLRVDNGLEPHRIGSIRHTWPYNRP